MLENKSLGADELLKLIEGIREYFRKMDQPNSDSIIKIKKLEEEINKIKKNNLEILEKTNNNTKLNDDIKQSKIDLIKKDNKLLEKENIILQKNEEIEELKSINNKIKEVYKSKVKEDYNIFNSKLEIKNKLLRDCEEKSSKITIPESLQKSESLEIRNLENVVTLYDESLRYCEEGKYFKISIYIQDANNKNSDKIDGLHKYHFYNCRTIQEMKSQKRDFRYCVSTRSDNYFKYKIYNGNKLIEYKDNQELHVCKNCLSIYNKQYKTINKIKIQDPVEFNEKNLLETYIKSDVIELDNEELVLISTEYVYDYEQIPNLYSESWPTISQVVKDSNNHTCKECQWQPKSSDQNQYLHVHHINFKKFDNNLTNLNVLCIDCHSKQPNHKHIRKSKEWKNFFLKK